MHYARVLTEAGATVVGAGGELDLYGAADLEAALEQARSGDAPVVVDLAAVSFMDSTALGALVRGVRALERAGVAARVVLPRGAARRVFEITAVDRVIPVAASRAAALTEVGAGA